MFKKILTSSLLSLIALGGFFGEVVIDTSSESIAVTVSSTYAGSAAEATTNPAGSQDQKVRDMYNNMVAGINIFLDVLTAIVSPAIMLAGWLMSPDWTSGDLFGIRPVIHDLWVLVSNVTYFIYALLLIFIALATIFNSDNYGYKKLLPRLALGIILVPITWWFVQFIISLSSIVTASVMNIPAEVMNNYVRDTNQQNSWWNTPGISKEYEYFTEPGVTMDGVPKQYISQCPGSTECISPKDILTKSSGMYSALLIYGNAIFKIQETKKLATITDGIVTVAGLINKGIIAIVMFIVFGLLVLGLVFLLLMRAIKLWFYAIFSPLMTLKYVLGDGIFGNKDNASNFEIKEFVGLAFVPAIVGVALSFGIVVLALLQSPGGSGSMSTNKCTAQILKGDGCTIANIMGSPDNKITKKIKETERGDVTNTQVTMGGIKFNFYGSIISGKQENYNSQVEDIVSGVNDTTSIISGTGNVFGTIIINIIGLMFLWFAFMAAKGVTKIADTAFTPFENFGKKMMGTVKYAPIPFTGGVSANSLSKVGGLIETNKMNADQKRFEGSTLGKALIKNNMGNQADITRMKELVSMGEKDKQLTQAQEKELMDRTVKNAGSANANRETYKGTMEYYRRVYKNQADIQAALMRTQELSQEDASKLAKLIADGKTDLSIHRDTSKFFEEIGKKSGGSNGQQKVDASLNTTLNVERVSEVLNLKVGSEYVRYNTKNGTLQVEEKDKKEFEKFTRDQIIQAMEPKFENDNQKAGFIKALDNAQLKFKSVDPPANK